MNTDKTPLAFRRYPSTTALQCFETAARHLSFTNAAQEMHMTQSAISKQVAQLEEMLNLSLFYRTPHLFNAGWEDLLLRSARNPQTY